MTQLTQQSIALLEPIYDAQFDSIRADRVKAMDETPIKAGRKERGKMKVGYFWPVYGGHDEVCFPFLPSREAESVHRLLGVDHAPGSVILTDGYAAYASYARKVGIAHALCWSHSRREFVEAQSTEPQGVLEALRQIGALYAVEEEIRPLGLMGEVKKLHRLTHSKSHVEAFFAWVDQRLEEHGLCPTTPLRRRSTMCVSGGQVWRSFSPIRMCHWTPTTWSARCAPSRWAEKIGISVGLSWVPNRSALCRA